MNPVRPPHDEQVSGPVASLEAAAFHQAAMTAATEGLIVACQETLQILMVNPATCRMLGYDEAALLKLKVTDLHPVEMQSFIRVSVAECCAGRRSSVPSLLFRRGDGTLFPGDLNAAPFVAGGRRCVVGLLSDRSEQQALQGELMGVRDWLRALVEAVPHPIFAKDRGGRYTLVNPAWEAVTGRRAADVLGRTASECPPRINADLYRQDATVYRDHDDALLATGGTETYEGRLVTHSGETRDVMVSKACTRGRDGSVTGLVGSVLDLTERKRVEQALADSEARLRATLDAAHTVAFVIADTRDADVSIVEFSPGAERLFGWTRAEALGRPISMLTVEPQRLFPRQPGKTDRTSVRDEVQLARRDGGSFPAMVTLCPLRGSTAQGTILMVAVDLSRVRAAELERERLAEQLRQVQKMESLGTLAGGIAHDFNNLLGVILGHAEVVQDEVVGEGEAGIALQRLVAATHRARDLVRRLLAFARRAEGEPRPVALAGVIDEAVRLVRATIPVSTAIHVEFAPGAGYVHADPVQVQQVLINLVTNAWHAVEPGGTMWVRVAPLDVGEGVPSTFDVPPGRWALLEVRDSGHGMDADTLARVFEPYFTTKAPGRGTGLGLSVVHGIVTAHGGHIRVQSREGEGTVVRVLLPRLASVPVVATLQATGSAPHGTGRILLAEDEDDLRDVLVRHLRALGYTVFAFSTAEQALEHARSKPDEVDALLTDMTMPGMSGAELADGVRALRPDLPVIICTGYSELLDEAGAARRGYDGFLMKPVGRAELATALREVLRSPE